MTHNVFVLDTSVVLAEGKRVFSRFENATVILPLTVVTELESKRNDPDLGYSARSVLRELDDIRQKGDISKGVQVGNIVIKVELNHVDHESIQDIKTKTKSINDVRIISVARSMMDEKEYKGSEVVLLSKDIPLKILADLVGVAARDITYESAGREFIDRIPEYEISGDEIDTLYNSGVVFLDYDVPVNSGVVLRAGTSSALALAKPGYRFSLVGDKKLKGLSGRSAAQSISMEQLTDDTIKAVSLGGRAGTGKTVMALAAGIDAIENHGYKKIVVFRSMHAVGGEDLGFLPGSESEKMDPWTRAVYDALSSLDISQQTINTMKAKQQIEVLPITHIRGRTFNNTYIVVDEAQNLTRDTIMTILTRAGAGTKVVLTHDVSQRDNLHVGKHEGIFQVVSKMHGNKLFAHTELTKSERSELAQVASELLEQ